MLSQTDEDSLAVVYRNLQEKPIEPGHPIYIEIWEHSGHDPIARLRRHIDWTEIQSLQLFTGFNGSGKNTQLHRLQQELTAQGYLVVYADVQDYLNPGEPIEIEDLLIVIASAFSDTLDPTLIKESYWNRLTNYLVKTEVDVKDVTFKLSEASFKAELKTSPNFGSACVRSSIASCRKCSAESKPSSKCCGGGRKQNARPARRLPL